MKTKTYLLLQQIFKNAIEVQFNADLSAIMLIFESKLHSSKFHSVLKKLAIANALTMTANQLNSKTIQLVLQDLANETVAISGNLVYEKKYYNAFIEKRKVLSTATIYTCSQFESYDISRAWPLRQYFDKIILPVQFGIAGEEKNYMYVAFRRLPDVGNNHPEFLSP